MSLTQDVGQSASVARFTLDELRAWRLVLTGLRLLRAPLRLVLMVSCPCLILAIVLDRSDRALPLMVIAGGQVLLAVAQVAGVIFICFAPAGSETRRRARQTVILMIAAVLLTSLVSAFFLGQVLEFILAPLGFGVRIQILVLSILSLLINIAFVETAVIDIQATLGRDLGDLGLTAAARRLAVSWFAFSTLGFVLLLLAVLGPLRVIDPLRLENEFVWFVVLVASLLLFEALYSRLANRAFVLLRMSICDVHELHAWENYPGASL